MKIFIRYMSTFVSMPHLASRLRVIECQDCLAELLGVRCYVDIFIRFRPYQMNGIEEMALRFGYLEIGLLK